MGTDKLLEHLNPCGLNCAWCVYGKMNSVSGSGCPGCEERMDCLIRACAEKSGRELCAEECAAFPCYSFLQGYQCMKEHYAY